MLRRAVRYAIEQKVDLILFSGSFEGGGNGDGRGPDQPDRRRGRGGRHPLDQRRRQLRPARLQRPGRVLPRRLPPPPRRADVAALRFRNRLDENTVTVTLTWNDYRDEEDAGTDKDLDLYVEDWAGRRRGRARRCRSSGDRAGRAGREPQPPRARRPDRPAAARRPADPDYGYRIRIRAKRAVHRRPTASASC